MKVAICTGSFACKVSSFGKQETVLIHTTVMSYTWQALWKKRKTKQNRELGVLIITQNMNCLVFLMAPFGQFSALRKGVKKRKRVRRSRGLETGQEGFRQG